MHRDWRALEVAVAAAVLLISALLASSPRTVVQAKLEPASPTATPSAGASPSGPSVPVTGTNTTQICPDGTVVLVAQPCPSQPPGATACVCCGGGDPCVLVSMCSAGAESLFVLYYPLGNAVTPLDPSGRPLYYHVNQVWNGSVPQVIDSVVSGLFTPNGPTSNVEPYILYSNPNIPPVSLLQASYQNVQGFAGSLGASAPPSAFAGGTGSFQIVIPSSPSNVVSCTASV